MISIVHATPSILREVYPEGMPMVARTVAVVDDGRLLGLGMLVNRGANLYATTHITPELAKHPRWILKGARQLLAIAKRQNRPVYARAEDVSTSVGFLEHFGFVRCGEEFVWR